MSGKVAKLLLGRAVHFLLVAFACAILWGIQEHAYLQNVLITL